MLGLLLRLEGARAAAAAVRFDGAAELRLDSWLLRGRLDEAAVLRLDSWHAGALGIWFVWSLMLASLLPLMVWGIIALYRPGPLRTNTGWVSCSMRSELLDE